MLLLAWFRPRLVVLLSLVLLVLLAAPGAGAQQIPNTAPAPRAPAGGVTIDCVSGCTGSSITVVAVLPVVTVPPNSTGQTVSYIVRNGTATLQTLNFSCSATGDVTCTGTELKSYVFDAGESLDVMAFFSTGALSTGTLTFIASGAGGSSNATVVITAPPPQGPPIAVLRNHNGDNRDRGLCLTSGAGEAAAWQCGDLLVAHGTPAYATMGRDRSLTLLYSSAQAVPRPAVAAAVTQSASQATPTTVLAELQVNSGAGFVTRASASYGGWASGTRQLVLPFTDTTSASGIYPYQLVLTNQYPGGSYATTVSGTLLLVNRAASLYGRGWSLAGVEQLLFNQPVSTATGDILWLGGDGSARRYASLSATTWLAPAGAFRDTLVFDPVAHTYTRTLRHGIQVVFDSLGRHGQTVNRTGQRTRFFYSGGSTQLDSVRVPPTALAGTRYRLGYAAGALDYIEDPAGRRLEVTVAATGRLTAITDPDTALVPTQFGYDAAGRMTSRTSRRGFVTTFAYANGFRLTRVIVPGTLPAGDTTVFQPWDEQGLAGQAAVDTALASTTILGPRAGVADDARFGIDRWGAPTRIVNPLGQTTTLLRGDGANPALVTRLILPDGRIQSMSYNSRGNLTQTRDSSLHLTNGLPTSVTTWSYASPTTPDAPDAVTDPEGVVTRYSYNAWGLIDLATAPNGHQTQFTYKQRGGGKLGGGADSLYGLLQAVTELGVPAWDSATATRTVGDLATRFGFNALGNVVADTSPMGRVRGYTRDAWQRVTTVVDAGGYRTDFTYDPLNRGLTTQQHVEWDGSPAWLFPKDSGYTAPIGTRTHYALDVVDSVLDPRNVLRRFQHDGQGRPTADIDDYGNTETRWFNAAGQIDSVQRRTGQITRYSYDPGGRVTYVTWPARDLAPLDTVRYTYDSGNRMLTAVSRSGTSVTRTYWGDGLLKSEDQVVTPFLTMMHRYAYDRAGRRIAYVLGTPGDTTASDSTAYRYDPTAGTLRTIWVHWRHPAGVGGPSTKDSVEFGWDALGRRDSVLFRPIGATERFAYDQEGALRVFCTSHPAGNPYGFDALNQSVYRKWIDPKGRTRLTVKNEESLCRGGLAVPIETNTYDARGQLLSQSLGAMTYLYRYDASGNMTFKRVTNGSTFNTGYGIATGHNRLTTETNGVGGPTTWTYSYYPDGGRNTECPNGSCAALPAGYRHYYYDGLNRIGGTQETGCTLWNAQSQVCLQLGRVASVSCRYDPLGRMSSPCENGAPFLGFDGDNVSRTDNGGLHGWSIVHGPGTDDPLLGYNPNHATHIYYLTDGLTRQYAVTDRTGTDMLGQGDFDRDGGKYAGGTRGASTFGAERNQSASTIGLSFFRNRFYDQRTGRWTQEDPIGLAGGVNLYQFNGNNPAAYTDPFGLCPPKDFTTPCGGQDLINQVAGRVQGLHSAVTVGLAVQLAPLVVFGAADVLLGNSITTVNLSAGSEAAGASEVSSGAMQAMQSQLEAAGRKSVEKTIRTLTRRIAEHEARMTEYRAAGGNVSSMEREVNAFRETIDAAKKVLETNQ